MSRDSRFNMEIYRIKQISKMVSWLSEAFVKGWPAEKELEMLHIPWLSVDEGIFRLKGITMLQCIFCVKSNPPQYEGPEVLLFINFVTCKIVKEAPGYLKEFVVATFLI